jgi:hypothetical protein
MGAAHFLKTCLDEPVFQAVLSAAGGARNNHRKSLRKGELLPFPYLLNLFLNSSINFGTTWL